MRNTLTDLNNYLFETLERLMDDSMTEEQMQKANIDIWRGHMDSKSTYTTQKLHEKELRLLEFIRRLGYGELVIKVQDGLPVMVERVKEKVKL